MMPGQLAYLNAKQGEGWAGGPGVGWAGFRRPVLC